MKIKFLLLLFFICSCSSQEFRLIGITSKQQELFYYGENFTVAARKIDSEKLNKIKLELKNSIAVQNLENPKEKWKEITELSIKDGNYVLFQILPDSRVPKEFLIFQFLFNNIVPIKKYSYYSETIETNIRTRYYYPGPFYIGGVYNNSGSFSYPMQTRLVENDISQKLTHTYNFLILFPKDSLQEANLFRITTPNQNLIEFEFNIP